MNFNSTDYYYVRNGQGDVIKLIDGNGTTVTEYTYDTWGKLVSCTGSLSATLGALNPFRYRGYVYDTETGWYYLQSRYYDPEVGRFLSADVLLSTGQGVLGHNTFVYCLNNPVNSLDDEGSISKSNLFSGATLLAIGVTALCAAISIVSCGTAAPLMVAVAAVTIVAATATVANGVSEVVEGFTATSETSGDGFNPMRDVAYGGDQKAYDAQKEFYSTVAQTGATICSVYMAVSGPVCFVAGTQILTDEGSVPIEEIEEGDSVYATDPETGESGFKRVVQTFERETDKIVKVTYDGETVTTTPTHPFYSPQKGWVEAIKLRAGDILVTSNGEYVVVEQVQHELLETPITVYNFEVEDYHTYYVSASAESNDSFVLVHNKCHNPGGRHGGSAHRAKISEVKDSLSRKGWVVSDKESRVLTGQSSYRYPDIIATKNDATRYYQIGRATLSGRPVARELYALRDLGKIAPTFFIRYN